MYGSANEKDRERKAEIERLSSSRHVATQGVVRSMSPIRTLFIIYCPFPPHTNRPRMVGFFFFKSTHLAGVDLLAAERVVVGTHLDGGCADEVSVGVG